MRTLALTFALACGLLADDANQRQVVRVGTLDQLTPKKGKHKVPKPYTAQRVQKPSKRVKKSKVEQPVWGPPNHKSARRK